MVTAALVPLAGFGTHVASLAVEVRNALVEAAKQDPNQDRKDFLAYGTRIRAEPSTTGSIRGIGSPGDTATVHLQLSGENVVCPDGRTNSQWWSITDKRSHVTGFVSACLL